MAKGTSQAKAMLNSKKIKPVALAIVKLRESEDIRQAVVVSQSVVNNLFFFKFCSNFFESVSG